MGQSKKQTVNPEAFKLKAQLNRTDLMIGRLETRISGINRELKRLSGAHDVEKIRQMFTAKGREA